MSDDRFVQSWQLTDSEPLKQTITFEGRFLEAPVFHDYVETGRDVFVCCASTHGKFIDCVTDGQRVRVFVDLFDSSAAEQLLAVSPPMRRGDRELTKEAAIVEIMDRARIRIIFGTSYTVQDPGSAILLAYPRRTASDLAES